MFPLVNPVTGLLYPGSAVPALDQLPPLALVCTSYPAESLATVPQFSRYPVVSTPVACTVGPCDGIVVMFRVAGLVVL